MNRAILIAMMVAAAGCGQSCPHKEKCHVDHLVWDIDNTVSVGGHPVRVLGSPEAVHSDGTKALFFDGEVDGLFIDVLPVAGWRQFTVEILLRPDSGGLPEQRFLHLQERGTENRIMLETRLNKDGTWYADAFMKSGSNARALIDPNNLHPTGTWYSFALVYDGHDMTYYIDGKEEMTAEIAFAALGPGSTSIGVRQNLVHWYKGAIRTIRFTPRALQPAELLRP